MAIPLTLAAGEPGTRSPAWCIPLGQLGDEVHGVGRLGRALDPLVGPGAP
jgi:hypothetical protein